MFLKGVPGQFTRPSCRCPCPWQHQGFNVHLAGYSQGPRTRHFWLFNQMWLVNKPAVVKYPSWSLRHTSHALTQPGEMYTSNGRVGTALLTSWLPKVYAQGVYAIITDIARVYQSGISPKVVALFSATNTSSNIVWSISTAWYNPNEIKWNLILVPNLVAFISQKEKNVCFFDYHSLTRSVRKMVLIYLMQNIDMYLLYKSHQIARLVSHLINHFSKWMFTVWQENATKFGTGNEISHIFLYH